MERSKLLSVCILGGSHEKKRRRGELVVGGPWAKKVELDLSSLSPPHGLQPAPSVTLAHFPIRFLHLTRLFSMASRWDDIAHDLGTALKLDDEQFEAVEGRRTGDEGEELVRSRSLLRCRIPLASLLTSLPFLASSPESTKSGMREPFN